MAELLATQGFKSIKEIVFLICFCFWFVSLLCRLLQRDLGELVSVMERNPECSMKTLHEHVNHDFARGLARRFLGSERTRIRRVYMMLAEKNKRG
jgi:hypothetical protein